jgi:hypothetical protein
MKLVVRMICVTTLALVLVGLALHLSAGNLTTVSEQTHDEMAGGLVNLGDKLAIIIALIVGLFAGQRSDWRWVVALAVFAFITLLSGPLSALTNTGPALYILSPIAVAVIALVYTFRMRGSLAPVHAWWRAPSR